MGDTGSMLIGLLLSASAIMLSGRVDQCGAGGELLLPAILPLLLPLAVIAVPLLDVGMAVAGPAVGAARSRPTRSTCTTG